MDATLQIALIQSERMLQTLRRLGLPGGFIGWLGAQAKQVGFEPDTLEGLEGFARKRLAVLNPCLPEAMAQFEGLLSVFSTRNVAEASRDLALMASYLPEASRAALGGSQRPTGPFSALAFKGWRFLDQQAAEGLVGGVQDYLKSDPQAPQRLLLGGCWEWLLFEAEHRRGSFDTLLFICKHAGLLGGQSPA